MPKIIENVRTNILNQAATKLLSEGYSGLSLREISKECGIAVGTIYNYFPSKLTLISAVILEDWKNHTEIIQQRCNTADTVAEGIQSIYDNLLEFELRYQDVWSMSINSKDVQEELKNGQKRHQQLIDQLTGYLQTLFDRFQLAEDSFTIDCIARMLLVYIKQPDVEYSQLNKIIAKII